MKITRRVQQKLEEILTLMGFRVRYEKGNFRGGYCVLDHQRLVVINQYYTQEGKTNILIEVLNGMNVDESLLTDDQLRVLKSVRTHAQTHLQDS